MSNRFTPIKDFDDYQIDLYGNVYSVRRGIILKPCINKGYHHVVIRRDGKSYKTPIHRLLYQTFVGELIPGMHIDHIDHNRSNNSLSNLRQISHRANSSHRKKKHTSKYVGVCWVSKVKKWKAQIAIDGRNIFLGQGASEYDAHLRYQGKLKELQETPV